MLLQILVATSLVLAPQISMKCVDTGAVIASTRTQPVRGPGSISAVLKVSTADDHSKNYHGCSAEYQLLLRPAASAIPLAVDLLTSDAEYGRSLSLSLDGFTQDGKRVFGIFSEGGKYPFTTLFDYSIANGKVQLIDLTKQFAHLADMRCSPTVMVIGTTAAGAIVVELDSAKPCAPRGRWLIDSNGSTSHRLPQGAAFLSLYKSRVGTP